MNEIIIILYGSLLFFLDEWMNEWLLHFDDYTIALIPDMQSWKILLPLVYFFDDVKKGEKVVYCLSKFFKSFVLLNFSSNTVFCTDMPLIRLQYASDMPIFYTDTSVFTFILILFKKLLWYIYFSWVLW